MSWECADCPSCEAENWIDQGDPQDMTVTDYDGCECRGCKFIFPLHDDLWTDDPEEWHVADGMEPPSSTAAKLKSIRDQADLLLQQIDERQMWEGNSTHDMAQLFCRIVHSANPVIIDEEDE